MLRANFSDLEAPRWVGFVPVEPDGVAVVQRTATYGVGSLIEEWLFPVLPVGAPRVARVRDFPSAVASVARMAPYGVPRGAALIPHVKAAVVVPASYNVRGQTEAEAEVEPEVEAETETETETEAEAEAEAERARH